jgi:large subunit ribosomal protein L18
MKKSKEQRRIRRKMHIKKKLHGTDSKPRVYVNKSNKYVTVGVANDDTSIVLLTKTSEKGVANSKKLGNEIGSELKKKKLDTAVFDRSGYKYHGNVKAVVEGLRESGIII